MGDQKVEECTEGYGLGSKNESGNERRILPKQQFCSNKDIAQITQKLTWRSPADQDGQIVKNQISIT